MIKWEKTKYGYELIEDEEGIEFALLKYRESEKSYYISCMGNMEVNIYLNTDDLSVAKETTINKVKEDYRELINYYGNIIANLTFLKINDEEVDDEEEQ